MTQLTVSHYMPADHGTHIDFIAPWARRIEAACPSLSIEIFCEGSRYGKLENQYEQVMSGAVDIAHSPASLPADRYPLINLMNLPFLVQDARQASERLWQAHDRFLADEFQPLHVLAFHADSGGILHMREPELASVEDLSGKRIRTPAGPIAEAIAALGAEPVLLRPPAIGEAARMGKLDGAIMAWDVLAYTGTQDIFRHHFSDVFYVSPLYFVMNPDSRARLTHAERAAVDQFSGADLAGRFGNYWSNWSRSGRLLADGPGRSLSSLPDPILAALRTAAAVSIEKHIGHRFQDSQAMVRQVINDFKGIDTDRE